MSHPTATAQSLMNPALQALLGSTIHTLFPIPSSVSLLPPAASDPTAVDNVDSLIDTLKHSVRAPSDASPAIPEVVASTVLLHSLTSSYLSPSSKSLALPRSLLPAVYAAATRKLKALNVLLGSTQGNVLCAALLPAIQNCHSLALLMDSNFGTGSKDHDRLEATIVLLQDTFSKSLKGGSDFPILDAPSSAGSPSSSLSEAGSKKTLVLPVVNLLFASYFKLNTLRLCKNIQQPVENKRLHLAVNNLGGKGATLVYRYYTGRLAMFENDYEAAEEALAFAYENCPAGEGAGGNNRRRALAYLIPVRLLRGVFPTAELLEENGMAGVFGDIVEGLRLGDLRRFNDGLRSNHQAFIKNGTYLLVESCQVLCFRNLFKRVYLISEKTQLPISSLTTAFKWLGVEMDADEVECVLANLIFKGYVRGYISHSKRILVLSKKEPFPAAMIAAAYKNA